LGVGGVGVGVEGVAVVEGRAVIAGWAVVERFAVVDSCAVAEAPRRWWEFREFWSVGFG
jgi:hypothetical protein